MPFWEITVLDMKNFYFNISVFEIALFQVKLLRIILKLLIEKNSFDPEMSTRNSQTVCLYFQVI